MNPYAEPNIFQAKIYGYLEINASQCEETVGDDKHDWTEISIRGDIEGLTSFAKLLFKLAFDQEQLNVATARRNTLRFGPENLKGVSDEVTVMLVNEHGD